MTRRRSSALSTASLLVLGLSVTVGAVAAACGGTTKGDESVIGDTGVSGDSTSSADAADTDPGDTASSFDVGERKPIGLDLEPKSASLVVKNGDVSKAIQAFRASVKLEDGSLAPYSGCAWTLDNGAIGTVKAGTFEATGTAGGRGKITCAGLGFTTTALVDVRIEDVDDTSGLDDTTRADLLAATAPDPKVAKLLYPYDNTVFPRGLEAPELMWNGGSAADVYALTIEETSMSVTTLFKPGAVGRAQTTRASWNKLLDSNANEPVTVTLRRLAGGPGGTPYLSTKQTWKIAAANLKGSIYFWSIVKGSVLRLRPGAAKPESFLKVSGKEGRCVACHSVSLDGSTIAASYDGGASPWVTFDASGTERYSSGTPSGFQAISPDGKLVVFGQSQGGTLKLAESTGKLLEPSGADSLGNAVHYTFSPNGKMFAYGVRKDGNWLDFNQSDLSIADFDPTTNKFSGGRVLRASGGRGLTYPSFSPDNAWVAYQDGAAARTRNSKADIHMLKPDGSGDVLLSKACTAGIDPIDASLNYEPTFSPLAAGGYYWMVFVSSRQLGNRLNTTNEAGCTGDYKMCRRKQLWVTAVNIESKPGEDPSHPAFWLPGQDLDDQNMRGFWALDACRKLGEGCESGFECCEGSCRLGDDGKKLCVKPPPDVCKPTLDRCTKTSECCDAPLGIECIGDICTSKRPS